MLDQDSGFSALEPASSMPGWYADLLGSVSRHVSIGRRRAVRAANQELVLTYWHVGKEILERQTFEGYGTQVVNRLSADLKHAFPESTGFSPRNLRYMRALAAAWPEVEIVQRSAAQLPWRHHQHLLDKLEDTDSRLWYAAQAVEHGWSRDVLAWQIETGLRERSGKAITNFDTALPPKQSDLAQQATKDPYLFDFLGTTEPVLERDLERKLLEHASEFLLEARPRLCPRGEAGAADPRRRRVLVRLALLPSTAPPLRRCRAEGGRPEGRLREQARDLSSGPRRPARSRRREAAEKPTIGILLCKTKNAVVAEYALRGHAAPIGVAEWAAASQDRLPADLAAGLPSVETLEAEHSHLDLDGADR